MNENENEKKPEEGADAAPETNTDAGEAVAAGDAAAEEPVAAPAEPEAEAPSEPESQPVAAMFDDVPAQLEADTGPATEAAEAAGETEEPSDTWVTQPFEQPDPGAGSEASAEAEPAGQDGGSDAAVVEEPAAEQPSFAWATQPMEQADAEAGAAAVEPEPEPAPEPQPLRIYEYRFIRVKQNTWDSVEAAILANAAAVAEAGGQLFGVWAGQIGLSANQGIVVTVWTDIDTAKRKGQTALAGINDVSASETLYMEPTTRPVDATPPEGPGIFAHRIFETRREDTERFVQLSDEAWPQFEEVFGTKIFALWRETGHDRAFDRLILLTRYPDYAAWQNSRFWRPEPEPNAADALEKFRERRQITVDTVVYTTRLAEAAG